MNSPRAPARIGEVSALCRLASAIWLAGCSALAPTPTELVRSSEPIDEGLCIALDAADADDAVRAQVWWWNPGDRGCASTNSSIVPATGVISVVDGGAILSFDVPLIPDGSQAYRLPIVQGADGHSLAVSGRLVSLEPITELRLPSPGGIETPMP